MDENLINTGPIAAPAPPRRGRALEIILLAIVATTALAYPLCLPQDILKSLYSRLSGSSFYAIVYPWISCGFTPLVVKESLLLTFGAALLFVFAWIKVRGQWLGVEQSALGQYRGRQWLLNPDLWLTAGVLYGVVSIAWSEVFNQSLSTAVLLATGASIILVIRSQPSRGHFAIKFMVLCVLCGAVIATLALLQHLDRVPFLPQSSDPRNRMSSLIGHNTGMSSWLMFPLSFSFYFMMTNRRLWARAVAALLAILFVMVIIAAQSRAIWVLAAGLCIIVPWKLFRINKRRVSAKGIGIGLAVLAVVILALTVSPQTNPLARLPVSLEERVTGHILNLDQLRRETRLRILVVSLAELFPQAPVFGTGWGSFAWVYPKAQGAFFTANPDTWLGTTTRRTDLAHNDYLQVLIETGLLGFALLTGFLYTFARESRKSLYSLVAPRDRALWWALAAPAVAVALHALVDFPFHVAPLALVALVSASLTTRILPSASSEERRPVAAFRPAGRRVTGITFLITAAIFAWLPWGWQALVGRVLVSDGRYNAGLSYLDEYRYSTGQSMQMRLAMLDRAQRLFREAVVINVFNGEAYQGQATAFVNRAALLLHEIDELKSSDTPTTVATRAIEPLAMTILRDSQSAITITENQLHSGGLRYHYTFYLLGRAWRLQWELEKDSLAPEESQAYSNAVTALRTALEYNPADSLSVKELSELLAERQQTVDESQNLQSKLFKTDPWAADAMMLQPALEFAREGETLTARTMLEPVIDQYPDHPRVLLARAWLAFYEAVWPPPALDRIDREDDYLQWRREKLDREKDAIAALPDTEEYRHEKERLRLLFTAAGGEIKESHRLATEQVADNMWNREARAIMYWTDQRLYGGALKYEDSLHYFRTSALLQIYFMAPRKQGLNLAAYATNTQLPENMQITIPEVRRLTAFCVANDWWEFMSLYMPAVLKLFPGDEKLIELNRDLQLKLADTRAINLSK